MRRKKLNVKRKTLKGYGLLGHGTEKGMEADALLCSRNARSKTPLAWANGTSRRASGWAGDKVARSGRSNQPPSLKREGASLERRRERPGALLARRTRMVKGMEGYPHWSCAPGTRALRRMRREAWSSSCSRNAHDKNVLVRRAHSRIDQATLESEVED
jgi:hypothetical protein